MTTDYSNLHPMNHPEHSGDWKQPGWKPVGYPKLEECPKDDKQYQFRPMDPGSDEERDVAATEAVSDGMSEDIMKRWPTYSDFAKFVYERHVEGNALLENFMFPKRLVSPGGYHSPKAVPGGMFTSLFEVAERARQHRPILPTEITMASIMFEVLRYRTPIYYVTEELIRAVAATDLPKDFTLQDLHLPLPGMVFAFPVKFMKEYTGRDICYVNAAEFQGGAYSMPRELAFSEIYIQHTIETPPKFAWQFHAYTGGRVESYVSGYWKAHRIDEALTAYGYTDYTLADEAKVATDAKLVELVGALMFKLILVLNTRSGLVDSGVLHRSAKYDRKGKQVQSELWSPTTIGAHYRAPRHEAQGGAHASPRWHWRRGHVTHQRTGSPKAAGFVSIASLPKREDGEVDWLQVPADTRVAFWSCHKRLWLEPVLVNFDEPKSNIS